MHFCKSLNVCLKTTGLPRQFLHSISCNTSDDAASGKSRCMHMKNEGGKANDNTPLLMVMVMIGVLGTPGVPGTYLENHSILQVNSLLCV